MWDLPDLITSSDYTVYSSSVYQGVETRLFYDKAIPDFVNYPAHIFKVNFGDGLSVDFEIYSEFSEQEAISIEQKYAPLLGQLGKELRKNISVLAAGNLTKQLSLFPFEALKEAVRQIQKPKIAEINLGVLAHFED